jgi:hypothetical protein
VVKVIVRAEAGACRSTWASSRPPAWNTRPFSPSDTAIFGRTVLSLEKCLRLVTDRTFDKPYYPSSKELFIYSGRAWLTRRESPG